MSLEDGSIKIREFASALEQSKTSCTVFPPDVRLNGGALQGEDVNVQLSFWTFTNCIFSECSFNASVLYQSEFVNCLFRECDFTSAKLEKSVFTECSFINCDLSYTSFVGSNFEGETFLLCKMYRTNFSECRGMPSQALWLEEHLERCSEGYFAYKSFGTHYDPPTHWKLEAGSIITEVVDTDRFNECSHGINVATEDWVVSELSYSATDTEYWKVLIKWEDLADVCVPYNTDGRFRAGKVMLISRKEL